MSSTAKSVIAGKKPPEVSHAALRPNAALSDYLFVALGVGYGGSGLSAKRIAGTAAHFS